MTALDEDDDDNDEDDDDDADGEQIEGIEWLFGFVLCL